MTEEIRIIKETVEVLPSWVDLAGIITPILAVVVTSFIGSLNNKKNLESQREGFFEQSNWERAHKEADRRVAVKQQIIERKLDKNDRLLILVTEYNETYIEMYAALLELEMPLEGSKSHSFKLIKHYSQLDHKLNLKRRDIENILKTMRLNKKVLEEILDNMFKIMLMSLELGSEMKIPGSFETIDKKYDSQEFLGSCVDINDKLLNIIYETENALIEDLEDSIETV